MSQFIAWKKQGWATRGSGAGTSLADAGLTLDVRADGVSHPAPINVPARIAGPSDVVGISANSIRRVVPAENDEGFPDASLVFLEFATADLPWAVSPEPSAGAPQPWVALVVVPASAARVRSSEGPEILTCSAAELPDVATLHAFAHIHDIDGTQVSRVLGARRLQPGVRYIAALVPTFELGRRAALADVLDVDALPEAGLHDPAWVGGDDVELPVYFRWGFSTGPSKSLHDRVEALRRPDVVELGWRRLSASNPGLDLPDGGLHFVPGALVPPDSMPPAETPAATHEALSDAIATVLDTDDDETAEVPVVGPPLRGRRLLGSAVDLDVPWSATLNLNPAYRVIAGAAEELVRSRQDDLIAAFEESVPARSVRRDEERTLIATTTLRNKLGTHTELHPSYGLLLARTTDEHAVTGYLPRPTSDPALRRALRPGGALVRQLSRATGHAVGSAGHAFGAARDAGSGSAHGTRDPLLRAIASDLGTRGSSLGPYQEDLIPGHIDPLAQQPPHAPPGPTLANATVPLSDVGKLAVSALEASIDVLQARHAAVRSSRTNAAEALDTALLDELIRWDSEWLLPGLKDVPAESIVVLSPHGAFVEAFLIGANEELLRELLWREIPHRAGAPLAPCFWEPGVPDLDVTSDWSGELGSHVTADQTWVLVKSSLWRAVPDLAFVAYPASFDADGEPDPDTSGDWILPSQELWVGDDLVLVAFPMSVEELTGSDSEPGAFFVFSEPDVGAKFRTEPGETAGPLVPGAATGALEASARIDPPDQVWVWAGRYR